MYSRIVTQDTIDNARIVSDRATVHDAIVIDKLIDEANACERANEALVMQMMRLEDELDREREKRIEIARLKTQRATPMKKTTRGARGARG